MPTRSSQRCWERPRPPIRLDEGAGRVEADRSQLDQVILNLALNARDAMPGGGTLTLETGTRRLDEAEADALALSPGTYTTLAVRDTGTGMTEDVSSHAFEPFFTTKNGDSSGLGLATVYGIVKQSGGEIHVESSPGAGSTFTVYLPHVEATATPELARTPRGPRHADSDENRPRRRRRRHCPPVHLPSARAPLVQRARGGQRPRSTRNLPT